MGISRVPMIVGSRPKSAGEEEVNAAVGIGVSQDSSVGPAPAGPEARLRWAADWMGGRGSCPLVPPGRSSSSVLAARGVVKLED